MAISAQWEIAGLREARGLGGGAHTFSPMLHAMPESLPPPCSMSPTPAKLHVSLSRHRRSATFATVSHGLSLISRSLYH